MNFTPCTVISLIYCLMSSLYIIVYETLTKPPVSVSYKLVVQKQFYKVILMDSINCKIKGKPYIINQ